MRKILIILAFAFGLVQFANGQNSYAESKPSTIYVNGVQHHVEGFLLDGATFYKIQDIAIVFNYLLPKFSYQIRAGQLFITTKRNYTPIGTELYAAVPGKYTANQVASTVLVDGKTVRANVYQIRGSYCLTDDDFARILDVGRIHLPNNNYSGIQFATNFQYSPTVDDLKIKETLVAGNISYNLGRSGIGLEYMDYIYVIHKNRIVRLNKDGSGIKEFNVKAAHSLNGHNNRIYFYANGFRVQSVDLDGHDLRTEINPVYAMIGQEPYSLTYMGDMVFVKYNNRLWNDQWTDEIRWYTTSGRSEQVVYRINSNKRIIGDFFIHKNYLYFSVNWANRKNLNDIGKLGDKETLVEGNVSQPFRVGDKMYFKGTQDNLMYEMPLGTKGRGKKISDITVNRFYIIDDLIVYQKQEGLHVMKLNGSGVKTLVRSGVQNFNVAGDWIVYSERSNTDYGAKVALVKMDGSKTITLP
ncbi:MAG: DUF5050 domain-containing protein [Tenuifilaceae bacterium]|jgi:hypothetical protein|nr:DUF5050 domain-containing protein [Tenuifilaceae bacterium]